MTEVRPVRVRIRAPRIFAFQCLTTFDRSSPVWSIGLEPQVLGREGDALLVHFRRRTLGRIVGSVGRVRVRPPDRIDLELVDGALGALRENLVLAAEGEVATSLIWSADVDLEVPMGRTVGRLVAARALRSDAEGTLDRYRVTIEAAALAAGLRFGSSWRPTWTGGHLPQR